MGDLVLDASAAANFLLPDESNSYGDSVLSEIQKGGALVPVLWNYEIGNLMTMAVRRKRIDDAYRAIALGRLSTMPFTYWDTDGVTALIHNAGITRLANECALSFYDATYLYLASTLKLRLATLDARLVEAARKVGVRLFAG